MANLSICKQISCSYCSSALVNKKLLKLGFAILPCYIKRRLTPAFSSFPSSSFSVWTACSPVDLLEHELYIKFCGLDATFYIFNIHPTRHHKASSEPILILCTLNRVFWMGLLVNFIDRNYSFGVLVSSNNFLSFFSCRSTRISSRATFLLTCARPRSATAALIPFSSLVGSMLLRIQVSS